MQPQASVQDCDTFLPFDPFQEGTLPDLTDTNAADLETWDLPIPMNADEVQFNLEAFPNGMYQGQGQRLPTQVASGIEYMEGVCAMKWT